MPELPLLLLIKWLGLSAVCTAFVRWAMRTRSILPVIVLASLLLVTIIGYDVRLQFKPAVSATPPPVNPVAEVFAPDPPPAAASPMTVNDAALDALKHTYENAWVYYMLLQACGKTGPSDGATLRAAMNEDLALLKAPPALADNILTAAHGTLETLYDTMPCNRLVPQNTQAFQDYLRKLEARKG